MKRLLLLSLIIILSGCSSGGADTRQDKIQNERGGFTVAYEYPLDTDHVEMFVSTVPNFNPTGYDPSIYDEKYINTPGYTSGTWTSKPNDVKDWNGVENNLYSTHPPIHRIEVNGLTVGKTYYYKTVVVDKAGQRSIPSPEQTVTLLSNVSDFSWVDDFIINPYDQSIWSNPYSTNTTVTAMLPHKLSITLHPNSTFMLISKSVKCRIAEVKFKVVFPQPWQGVFIRVGTNQRDTVKNKGYYAFFRTGETTDPTIMSCSSYEHTQGDLINIVWGEEHVFEIIVDGISRTIKYYIDNNLVATQTPSQEYALTEMDVQIDMVNNSPTDYNMIFDLISCSYIQ